MKFSCTRDFAARLAPLTVLCLTCFSLPIQAQTPPAILTVSSEQSQGLSGEAVNVQVWPGRATAIDFSRVGEKITQVFLADPSWLVFATDTPLDKGGATALFLRQILPLKFPNLTTAKQTNLFVKTRTRTGLERLYTFNVLKGESRPSYNGLSVATGGQSGREPTLQVGASRPATLNDIERGLEVALRKKYTQPKDPVVGKVREFLALARNSSDKSLVELAQQLKVPLAVLTQLGSFGIEDAFVKPLIPAQEVGSGEGIVKR